MMEITGGKLFQFGAAFTASLMTMVNGMIAGWTSPTIPYFLSNETHIVMTRNEAEWMESILPIGAICALPLTAFCVGTIGRKGSLILASALLIITWIVIAVASSIWYFYIARLCQGLALNMGFVATPMYVGEISDKSIRGFLSSMTYVLLVLGILLIYTIASLVPFYAPSILAVCVLIIEIAVLIFLPESPYFLVVKGQHEEAASALRQFKKRQDVEKDLNEIIQAIENDNKEKWQLKEIVLVKSYRKSIFIMLILNVGLLFCGNEAILMNLHEILAAAGTLYVSPYVAGIIFASINVFSSIISSVVVDKLGRKQLLLISVSSTMLCLVILGIYFHLQQLGFDTTVYSWIPVVVVMVYIAVFRVGLGTVPIVITSEIFASKIKAFGMTFADGIYVVSSVLALQLFFILRDTFGLHASFYAFFCCLTLTLCCIIFFVPETKGKSLEEIQQILRKM